MHQLIPRINWRRFPLLKITPIFISGIISNLIFEIHLHYFFILISVLFYFIIKRKPQTSLLYIIIFLSGNSISSYKNPILKKNHYSHQLNDSTILIGEVINTPTVKQKTIKINLVNPFNLTYNTIYLNLVFLRLVFTQHSPSVL